MKVTISPFSMVISIFYILIVTFTIYLDRLTSLWIFIELSIFLFIRIIFLNFKSRGEGLLGYYLTQSGLSVTLLVFLLTDSPTLIRFVILAKLGLFPLNFWFYSIIIKRDLISLFYIITFQKLPPLIIISSILCSIIYYDYVLILNVLVCGLVAFTSSDFKTLLVSSSLGNNSWLIVLLCSFDVFLIFYILYLISLYIVISYIGSLTSLFFLLTLRGLPPFPLFYMKFLGLLNYFYLSTSNFNWFLGCIFIFSSLVLSSSYLRFIISLNLSKRLNIIYVSKDTPPYKNY
jgi:hypothetical protein